MTAILLATVVLAAPVPKELKKLEDSKAILGKWQGDVLGQKVNGLTYVFRFGEDGTCGISTGGVGKNVRESPAEYTLDSGQTPKRMKWLNGPEKSEWRCVYALDGDTLRVGFVHQGTEIPAEFTATGGEPALKGTVTIYELKRLRDDK